MLHPIPALHPWLGSTTTFDLHHTTLQPDTLLSGASPLAFPDADDADDALDSADEDDAVDDVPATPGAPTPAAATPAAATPAAVTQLVHIDSATAHHPAARDARVGSESTRLVCVAPRTPEERLGRSDMRCHQPVPNGAKVALTLCFLTPRRQARLAVTNSTRPVVLVHLRPRHAERAAPVRRGWEGVGAGGRRGYSRA